MLLWPCLFITCLLLSITLTRLLLGYAKIRLLDQPNQRSSHQVPTPRGGGMAIVITCLMAAPLLVGLVPVPFGISNVSFVLVWVAALGTALVGFTDDHISLKPRTRLLVQGLAAALVVWAINGLPVLTVIGLQLDLAWFGYFLAWLGVVWFINLYNFMDGIDGLAASQAVGVCLVMVIVHLLAGSPLSSALLPALLVSAAGGFLYWNWPPARIFMGDGGSGFLGLAMAALMLLDAASNPVWLWCWLVMMGVFVVDATWTLCRRWQLNCPLSEAHRTHAYQYATRRWHSHARVTISVWLINLCWLAPIAWMIALGYIDGVIGLMVAYLPLCYLARYFKAGTPE